MGSVRRLARRHGWHPIPRLTPGAFIGGPIQARSVSDGVGTTKGAAPAAAEATLNTVPDSAASTAYSDVFVLLGLCHTRGTRYGIQGARGGMRVRTATRVSRTCSRVPTAV